MSLILEALRKSEAARRRGQAPDVHAAMPPPFPAQTKPVPGWLWLLAGSVASLVVLALAWQLLAPTSRPLVAAIPVPGATTPVAQESAAQRTASKRPAPTRSPPPLPPVQRLIRTPAASPPPTQAPVATAAKKQEETSAPRQVATTSNSERMPAPVAPPSSSDVTVPAPDQMPISAPAIATLPPPSTPMRDDIETVSDLSPAERRALPPLRLSMHLWNPERARRFVIIDGNRLGEGDRSGDLVISAITSDGVVLDWRGRSLKLPIR